MYIFFLIFEVVLYYIREVWICVFFLFSLLGHWAYNFEHTVNETFIKNNVFFSKLLILFFSKRFRNYVTKLYFVQLRLVMCLIHCKVSHGHAFIRSSLAFKQIIEALLYGKKVMLDWLKSYHLITFQQFKWNT